LHVPGAVGGGQEVAGAESHSTTPADPASGGWVQGDQDAGRSAEGTAETQERPGLTHCRWWDTRARLLRMVHGVRGRMDGRRIKALGNSCSPQHAYPILRAIADVDSATPTQ
jgi:hypothetical protein